MPPLVSMIGKWRGGPSDHTLVVTQLPDGKLEGLTTGAKGGRAGFYGACLKRGAGCRGYWWDVDAGVTEGHRLTCTIEIQIDLAADPSGETMTAKYKTKDGGSGEWTAKRHNDTKDIKREDGKISDFVFKDKKAFDSLTANTWAERTAKLEKEAEELLETTLPRPFFDGTGAGGYLPGPGVGSVYMTEFELQKHLKHLEVEHAKATHEAYVAEVERLAAKIEKGAGNVDVMKKRKETIEKFIKGDVAAEKLKERKPFKPGNGKVKAPAEFDENRKPEPYMDSAELRRVLHKLDVEYNAKTIERLNKEIEHLEAVVAKGGDDAEKAKTRMEMAQKLLKGAKSAEKLKERPAMKPPSSEVHRKSDMTPPENMPPDQYLSAVDLERKLAHDDEAAPKRWQSSLEAEITKLEAVVAKGGDDAEKAKTRMEMAQKLLKGAVSAEKLKERKKFKLNPAQKNGKLSGTVMLHPVNVASMMRSMSLK